MLPLLHTAESLGCSLARLIKDTYGEHVRVPLHVEQALWSGYRHLYGPGGRQRVGLEFAALRQMVGNAMGGKLKLEQCQLFPFPKQALEAGPPLTRAQRRERELEARKAVFRRNMEMWAAAYAPPAPRA